MKAKTEMLVILSDPHIGSTIGLWPERFQATSGHIIGQSAYQRGLWKHWCSMRQWVKEVTKGRKYELLLNGDTIEGNHHRTKEIMCVDPNDMGNAAVQVLAELRESAEALWMTLGTECHVQNSELWIGEKLGAERDRKTGHSAFARLMLQYGSLRLSATHHCSATSRPWLESGEYSRFISAEIVELARNKEPLADILVRGHRHVPGHFSDLCHMGIVTGAWQSLTRHGLKVVPHALPRPSCAILDFGNVREGELPTLRHRKWLAK